MDSLVKAVQAADGPWPVMAIAIIGLYAIVWRYGGQILAAVQGASKKAEAAHAESMKISESIVTNHGSRNLGEAIDRLTEWSLQHMEEARADSQLLRDLRADFVLHQLEEDTERSKINSRIDKLEKKGA